MDFYNYAKEGNSGLLVPLNVLGTLDSQLPAANSIAAAPAPPSTRSPDAAPPLLIEPLECAPGPVVTLYSPESLREAFERNRMQGARSKGDREHVQALLGSLFSLGTLRRCRLPHDWEDQLDQLKRDQPNCSEVVDFIQREFSLTRATGQPARLPAILLDGPPGCGKTYFAEQLSERLRTGFLRVNLEAGQTAAELTGTASHWGNSQPGRLFDLLVNGSHANPVVLLDEVDKSAGHNEHSIDRALYALLEPGSAKAWADSSLPLLKMDLRHVLWILTSNELGNVPAPLRSRMQVFRVKGPSRAEALALARRIFEETALELHAIDFSLELSTPLLCMLVLYPLRVIHRFCRGLIAAAVRDGRSAVEAKDFHTLGVDKAALEAFVAAGYEPSPTRH